MSSPIMDLPPVAQVHDLPVPRDYGTVVYLAGQLKERLIDPGFVDLAQLHATVPGAQSEVVVKALHYLGHHVGIRHRDTGQQLVAVHSPGAVALADRESLTLAARHHPRPVTVRDLQRWLRTDRGITAWDVRGACDRLEAAGFLRPHPGAVRRPVTVWEVVPAAT